MGRWRQRKGISTSSPIEHPGRKLQLAAASPRQSTAEDDAVRSAAPPHGPPLEGQAKDASDRRPHGTPSRGKSQVGLYKEVRPRSAIGNRTPMELHLRAASPASRTSEKGGIL